MNTVTVIHKDLHAPTPLQMLFIHAFFFTLTIQLGTSFFHSSLYSDPFILLRICRLDVAPHEAVAQASQPLCNRDRRIGTHVSIWSNRRQPVS